MSFEGDDFIADNGFSSHELKTPNPRNKGLSNIFYIILVIIIGLVVVFSGYVIDKNLSKNPYQKDQAVDGKSGFRTLPTLGDILRGSGGVDAIKTGDDLNMPTLSGITTDYGTAISGFLMSSGDISTYTGSTGNSNILSGYDRVYLEHIRDFLNILDKDPNLKGYFDTDNITLSGQDVIKADLASSLPSTTLKLYGTTYPHIKNLYIIGVDSEVYYFDTINHDNGIRSFELDGAKGSLKPGHNTYYIVGTDGVKYYINYIDYETYDQEEFYKKLGKICLLDICTDPSVQLVYNANDGSYLQQNGDTVIKIIPEQEIIVATRCKGSKSSLISVKKIADVYKKTTKGCDYETNGSVTQQFVNYLGETVTSHGLMSKYPPILQWGNLSYIADFEISGDIKNLQKIEYLDYYDISTISTSKGYLVPKVSFELPGDVFINYKLSNTPIMLLGYTQLLPGYDFGSAYKIAPRSFDRTDRAIIYTIPGSDPNMASILNQKLFLNNPGKVVLSPNCGQPTSSTDPSARFGIYPIDDKYELIGFLNCNIIIRN